MKPTLEELQRRCPGVSPELAREHLQRLDERYFELFELEEVSAHLEALSALSPDRPVRILFRRRDEGLPAAASRGPVGQPAPGEPAPALVECTILGFDYPGFFSLLTGLLSAEGFNVRSGDVFTYAPAQGEPEGGARRRTRTAHPRRTVAAVDPLRRRRIIDHLVGRRTAGVPAEVWENRLTQQLLEVALVLEAGTAPWRASGQPDGAVRALQEARRRVNERVVQALAVGSVPAETVLYPVQIEVVPQPAGKAVLKVIAQDTPFFLYALSTALSLRSIFIDTIRIRTIGRRIEDEFSFLDAGGRPLVDPLELEQVKLSVLLTKQFTYFLGSAPDPYAALCRFEQLVESVVSDPAAGRWAELLSDPRVLEELARLLGASDFLWEDFIRLQYEALLPLLEPQVRGRRSARPLATLSSRLAEAIDGGRDHGQKILILNEFKDQEILLMELDHIVSSEVKFGDLSRGLTRLAEAVVEAATELAWQHLAERYGTPRTVAGLPARLAVFGLGKLGGGELGYASDIELLFVFSDHGSTDGPQRIDNGEFFELLVREATGKIRAKKQGIFEVDLRLRPHGASGPAACSLESFCRYYGPGGEAHPLERLALVRLRAFAGDLRLGAQIERLRDEMVYAESTIELPVLLEARRRQLDERTRRGELNAKFSPGALLDLEYTVMLLQLAHAPGHPELRTPYLREAIDHLHRAGVLASKEAGALQEAYEFLRVLINSLRMLRGSALDLFLPEVSSLEYLHLARRMGYRADGDLSPAQRLHLDFETHTAAVRAFVEQHFGRSSLPVPAVGNVADLVLSEGVSRELQGQILSRAGFRDTARAYRNIRSLAGGAADRRYFARLAVLATDLLRHQPDPDMALNNWERFHSARVADDKTRVADDKTRVADDKTRVADDKTRVADDSARVAEDTRESGLEGGTTSSHRLLLSQPRRLEILLTVFSGSQYLSDALIHYPEFFEWVTQPEHLQRVRSREELQRFFSTLADEAESPHAWRALMRRFKQREILRIGIRDLCLGMDMREIMAELSMLAETLIDVSLRRLLTAVHGGLAAEGETHGFCILAFGKLGGGELNYSSDIDLLGLSEAPPGAGESRDYGRIMESLRSDLADHLEDGQVYRVDLRLRPFGRAGELVASRAALLRYYREHASLWELQALLKARPVAGDLALGQRFLAAAASLLLEPREPARVVQSIEGMRRAAHRKLARTIPAGPNVKLGVGGIRDVEFLVQGLQLLHAPRLAASGGRASRDRASRDPASYPGARHAGGAGGLLSGNTLEALAALRAAGVVPVDEGETLGRDYLFLRRIEHYLQVFENQQTHSLPVDPVALEALARRLFGLEATAEQFLERVHGCLRRVEAAYRRLLLEAAP